MVGTVAPPGRVATDLLRNLRGQVGRRDGNRLAERLRGVFAAPNADAVPRRSRRVGRGVAARPPQPPGAEMLSDDLDDGLAYQKVPAPHRVCLRTTNGLERLNQEPKRRTRIVRLFPNLDACLRLVTGVAVEQFAEWESGRRDRDLDLLRSERPQTCGEEKRAAG